MRNLLIAAVGAVTLTALVACSDTTTGPATSFSNASWEVEDFDPGAVCGETSVDLIAGQHHDAGMVTFSNDGSTLYVTFQTDGGWMLRKTHVHIAANVGEIPTNGPGNPIPGQFEYSTTHDPLVNTFTLAIDIGTGWEHGDKRVIAAHAEVVKLDDDLNVIQEETAWGGDTEGPTGNRWWYYAEYSLQECELDEPVLPEGCETAFAFGDTQLKDLPKIPSSRWGWQITYDGSEPRTEILWAGAGKNDVTKGTEAGAFELALDGTTLLATFAPEAGFWFSKVHLYVDSEQITTSAPGQFGHASAEFDEDGRATFTIEDVNYTPTYVVAHAEVCRDIE